MPLSPCTYIWDYLFEDDAGRALLAVGERGISGKAYCPGSGVGNLLRTYLEIIKNMTNQDYIPQYGEVPYTEKTMQYLCTDFSVLLTDTGWKPEVSFEEGIRRVVEDTL
jgi:nucleoside-diphosphate-sugar epimerase